VGTPGTVVKLLTNKMIDKYAIKMLVIDEAELMLDKREDSFKQHAEANYAKKNEQMLDQVLKISK